MNVKYNFLKGIHEKMALIYVVIAATFASIVNFCMRKNLEHSNSIKGYFTLYFIFSFLTSFFVHRKLKLEYFSFIMSSVGITAGLLNFLMMILVARSLQVGPSSLTFTFQNSAAIFPPLFLFLLFGKDFGFIFPIPAALGFILLVFGLILLARRQKYRLAETGEKESPKNFMQWLSLVLLIFCIQGIILSIFQWRNLLLLENLETHVLIPWHLAMHEDQWFMPGFFLFPAILQSIIFGISEKRWFTLREVYLGILGGLLNGGATFFLLVSTKHATIEEKIILFPLFEVSVIFLCSLWGKKIYQESIYWPGLILCFVGVFLGSL